MNRSIIALLILIVIAIISIVTILFIFLTPEPTPEIEIIATINPMIVTIIPMIVTIIPHNPTVCEFLSVEVEFTDGQSMERSFDYDITAIQNGDVIISESGDHKHPGKHKVHESVILLGVMPIDITVTTDGVAGASLTILPENAINIDCEELHDTEDILPQ